jgi:hypothetical protein
MAEKTMAQKARYTSKENRNAGVRCFQEPLGRESEKNYSF